MATKLLKKKSAAPSKKAAPAARSSKKAAAGKVKKHPFAHMPKADEVGLEPIKTKYTRTAIIEEIAEAADISMKQAKAALGTLEDIIMCHLCGGAVGQFALPGLFKATVRVKPAVAGGKEAKNPFTGEMYITKPKPAQKVIKLLPLKKLKDAVATR